MSVVDFGIGKSLMASKYFGSGSMDACDMRKPAKSTDFSAKLNFSGLSTIPDSPSILKNSMVLHQWVSRSVS